MTTQWMFWGAFQILIYVQVHPSGFLCVRFVCLSTGVAAHLWSEKGTPLPLMRRDQLRASGPITSSRDCVCSMLIYNRHTWIFNDGRSVRQYQRCGHCFIYDTSISCLRAAIIEWWTKHQGRMMRWDICTITIEPIRWYVQYFELATTNFDTIWLIWTHLLEFRFICEM